MKTLSATNRAVKATAVTAMQKNLTGCVFAGVAFLFVGVFCGVITLCATMVIAPIAAWVLALAFAVCLLFPLFLGLLRYYRRTLWGTYDNAAEIFYYFSSAEVYKEAFNMSVLFIGRLLFYGILFNLPAIIAGVLSNPAVYEAFQITVPAWSQGLWPVEYFFEILGGIALFFFMLKFYLAPFLFVAQEGSDAASAFELSRIISRRSATDFFWLVISFAGWIILSLLVVPLVATLPYMMCAYAVHCRFVVAQYNKTADQQNISAPTFDA